MISLTKAAAEQVRIAAQQAGAENMGLRIAAKVNEAGMIEFGMGFDNERENDSIQESWGLTLLISAHSAPLLEDITIDFTEISPGEQRFVFMRGEIQPESGGCGSGGCSSGSGCGSGGCS